MVQRFTSGPVEKVKTDNDFASIGVILAKPDAEITNTQVKEITLKALRWLWARRADLRKAFPVNK